MRGTTFLVSFMITLGLIGCGGSSGGGTGGAAGGGSGGHGGSGFGGAGGHAGSGAGATGGGTAGSGGSSTAGSGGHGGGGAGGIGGGAAGTGGTGGVLAACGTSTGPNSGDTCNAIDATGACVTPTAGTGTPPTPTGGPIQVGTYDLVSATRYLGPDGGTINTQPLRETIVISADGSGFTYDEVSISGLRRSRQHGTATNTGTPLTDTLTCPPPGDGGTKSASLGYTANGTTFTLFVSEGGGGTSVNVYMKR